MTDERMIEAQIYERLSKVIDPELGRSVTDLGMIASIDATPVTGEDNTYDVTVAVELTVEGCPLSQTITNQINGAVASYPDATLQPHIEVGSMSHDKLTQLVAGLKAERKQNPFNKPGIKTRIFAIASGKGGVGKSSVTANLAATFAALGYDTAAIDADIYGFSLPRWFGVHATHQPQRHAYAGDRLGREDDLHRHVRRSRPCDSLAWPTLAAFTGTIPVGRVVGGARRVATRLGARHRRHGDFRGASPAERRTRGSHHSAAIRLRHCGSLRSGGAAGADEGAGCGRKHELFRA